MTMAMYAWCRSPITTKFSISVHCSIELIHTHVCRKHIHTYNGNAFKSGQMARDMQEHAKEGTTWEDAWVEFSDAITFEVMILEIELLAGVRVCLHGGKQGRHGALLGSFALILKLWRGTVNVIICFWGSSSPVHMILFSSKTNGK